MATRHASGLMSHGRDILSVVVPAQAGTHTPWAPRSRTIVQTYFVLWLWVPTCAGTTAVRGARTMPTPSHIWPRVGLWPAFAAVLEAEAGQHRRHPDRGADAFDHGYAEFLAHKFGLHVHRTLGDAMHDNDIGAVFVDQRAAGGREILDHHVLVVADVLELEAGGAAAGDPWLHAVHAGLCNLPRHD